MHASRDIRRHLSPGRIAKLLLTVILPAVAFYAASLWILSASGLTVVEILRDPAQQMEISSFLGFLSNVGTFLWVSATAICIFVLSTRGQELTKEERGLLLLVAAMSFCLAIDDFFLIHDRYIPQRYCYLSYALIAGAILVRHHRQILAKDPLAFVVAGSLLAASIGVDLLQNVVPISYTVSQVIEEGFKFVGAAAWLYFCARLSIVPVEVRPVTA